MSWRNVEVRRVAKNGVYWLNAGHWPVNFAFVPTEEAWRSEMRRIGSEAEWETGGSMTPIYEGEQCYTYVTLDLNEAPTQLLCTIVHEAVHVWQEIRDWTGETEPGSESEAYTVAGLVKELVWAVDTYRRARK